MGSQKPVLYLDVDDTLLSMHARFYPVLKADSGRYWGVAAPGAREFMEWALDAFEVRWLTWWCAWGGMEDAQRERLEREIGLQPGALAAVPGVCFAGDDGCHKTGGIKWTEHDAGRPFFWLEDALSEREQQVLRGRGYFDRWIPCHVTEDPDALRRAHARLARLVAAPAPHAGGAPHATDPARGAP